MDARGARLVEERFVEASENGLGHLYSPVIYYSPAIYRLLER